MRKIQKNNLVKFENLAETIIILVAAFFLPFVLFSLISINQLFSSIEAAEIEDFNENTYKQVETIDNSEQPIDHSGIKKVVNSFIKNNSGDFGIYVENFQTGQKATHQKAKKFRSASLYKLFVAHEILLQIDNGKYTLDQPTDTGKSIRECLKIMITISDNPCGKSLGNLAGWENTDQRLNKLGIKNTNIGDGRNSASALEMITTAEDIAKLYKLIYNQETLSKSSNDLLLKHLSNQQVVNRLPKGLPESIEIAHKTGDLKGYAIDAGIVYGGGDYVISVMSGPWEEANLSGPYSKFAKLSKNVYQYFMSQTLSKS